MNARELERVTGDIFSGQYYFPTSRGITALFLALRIIEAERGPGEVIVPATVCPSVPLAVCYAGLTPRFCDVELDTFCASPRTVDKCLSDRTVAVVAVHLFGKTVDVRGFQRIAKQRNIFLIEDVAQAIGSTCDGELLGKFGDFSVLSFNFGKVLPGNSGALLCRNRVFLDHATEIERSLPPGLSGQTQRELALGFRNLTHGVYDTLRANDLREAVDFLPQLSPFFRTLYVHGKDPARDYEGEQAHGLLKIETIMKNRKDFYHIYEKHLGDHVNYVRFDDSENCWRLPVMMNDHDMQIKLIDIMRERDILISNHYFPASHLFGDNMPVAAREIGLRGVNFWVDGKTTEVQIAEICETVNRFSVAA